MVERYGYSLPSTHKNYSPTYIKRKLVSSRMKLLSTNNEGDDPTSGRDGSFIIHDSSYYQIIELTGTATDIYNLLLLFTVSVILF